MMKFHVIIHGVEGEQAGALAVTFEEAVAALERLPRMFVEPDGSFVWAGSEADGTAWQVEGNLVDQGTSLAHVEVHGECPSSALDQMLAAVGWPGNTLRFQLLQRGVVLEEAAFRAAAAGAIGAV